ncbi:MAG: COQ9 family protein [Rhodospirillaceae bacterium]|nr:COQ9 family protein [Rhodospirillaceae bacterium]
MDETRDRLLVATLPHVPFDGWSEKALAAAAAELDIDPEEARHAFPGGPVALVTYHAAYADRRMEDALKETDLAAMRVRERIAHAVRIRLEQNAAHREAVRAALPILAQSANGPHALSSLYRTVDTIWFAVGDKTTDFGFYTKRALLAGVYLSTLLYWLNDGSEDAQATWAFLDRRIGDVMRVQTARARFAGFRPPGFGLLRRLREAARAAADPTQARGPQSPS